jgi:hypothetical protein
MLRHAGQKDMPLLDLAVRESPPLQPEHISRLIEHDLAVRRLRGIQLDWLVRRFPDDMMILSHFLRKGMEYDGAGGLIVLR